MDDDLSSDLPGDVVLAGDESDVDLDNEAAVRNENEFDCCFSIQIASHRMICYHSQTCQCEFVTSTAVGLFMQTESTKKALSNFKENEKLIVEAHRSLGLNYLKFLLFSGCFSFSSELAASINHQPLIDA